MKFLVKKGATSFICHVFAADTTSVTGAGKTGLVHGDIAGAEMRAGQSTHNTFSIGTITTLGTFAGGTGTGAFKEVSSADMPGIYELHIPNLSLAGADRVAILLKGSGFVIAPIEIQLTDFDVNSSAPDVNVAEIDNQSAAAVNLRKMLDGTGGVHVKLSRLTISASVPGGSGAVEITNTLGPAIRAVSINGHAVLLDCMAGDYAGLMVSGSGAGSGIMAGGGATGNGMRIDGGSTSGHGVEIVGGPGGSDIAADLAGAVSGVEEAGRQALADEVLKRNVSHVEASADEHSLCTIVLATLESAIGDTTWTIKRTDGNTTHATKIVTVNPEADPISGIS